MAFMMGWIQLLTGMAFSTLRTMIRFTVLIATLAGRRGARSRSIESASHGKRFVRRLVFVPIVLRRRRGGCGWPSYHATAFLAWFS
jgi:hypothetical protein